MTDHIELYKGRVRKRLSRSDDDPIVAEALCFPSFHPETLLRVTSGPAGTRFRLATTTSSMWFSESGATGETPQRHQEVCSVPSELALRFWTSMDQLKPLTIQAGESLGVDGMSIEASYCNGTDSVTFHSWCPKRTSPSGRFVALIYDLGWAVLKEPITIERLEQLHGYLDLGLPARMKSGEVTCLRLFGSLASYHQQELHRLFDSMPKDTPLVVDMTNFDGMGTLLYPTFVEFAFARRRLAWAGSIGAKRHLEAMRLPQIFDSVQDAIDWVKKNAV